MCLTIKKLRIMNTDFTKNAIENAVETISKKAGEFDALREKYPQLSLEEVAQKFILDKFDVAPVECEEVINNIKMGAAKFDTQFDKNKKNDKINVKEILEEATQEFCEEERKTCYVNILTTLELVNLKDLSEEDLDAKIQANTELSEDVLLTNIEKCVNSSISLDSLAEDVADGVDLETIEQLTNMVKTKEESRLKAAVVLYVAHREGDFKFSDANVEVSAEMIGALAAAVTEYIPIDNGLHEGVINVKTWQKVVKWIVGALVAVFLAYISFMVVKAGVCVAVGVASALFGSGIMFAIVAAVLCYGIIEDVSNGFVTLLNWCWDFYDKYIYGLSQKIKNVCAKMYNKAKNAVNNHTQTEIQETKALETETPQTETGNEDIHEGQPVTA